MEFRENTCDTCDTCDTFVLAVPFKTRKVKSRAQEKWSSFGQSAKFIYGGSVAKDASEDKEMARVKVERQAGDNLEVKYVRQELAKITILATSIIGLQILLKISRIGI